jgi:H+/gluconate symporter-like permease
MPAAIALGTSTFTMSALPGTPAIQNAIPMPFFGTTPFAAPGLGIIASAIMLGFGLWWLARAEAKARGNGEGYGEEAAPAELATPANDAAQDLIVRERATTASTFDPAEISHGHQSDAAPPIALAVLPLAIVVAVNLLMSLFILPRLDGSYLAEEAWGSTSLSAVGGVWAVATALAAAIVTLIAVNHRRLPALRASMDAGANASALMHRVAVIGAGTLDSLPHNGTVVTLLAVCGSTHRESYFDVVMVSIVGGLLALAAVIGLGRAFGSF